MELNDVLNYLFGRSATAAPTPQGQTYTASPRLNYPTSDDVDFARKYDYSYGQPWAPEFENKSATLSAGSPNRSPIPKVTMGSGAKDMPWPADASDMRDLYAKAALASEGSALAKLGFDPTKFAVDPLTDPKNSSHGGMYRPSEDAGWVLAKTPDSIVHESIHRGVDKLSKSPFWKKEFDVLKQDPENEYLVRHLMETKMGDPEANIDSWANISKNQRAAARRMFNQGLRSKEYSDIAKQMEDAAAQYIAAKHPGGPR